VPPWWIFLKLYHYQSVLTRRALLALLLILPLVALSGVEDREASAQPSQSGHTVVFMTDFGLLDDSVAICKAVMLQLDTSLRIMDITHQVQPYSILDGARFLAGTTPYYASGTVFVVVVDPGVGSKRKAIVAKSKLGQYFVLPDNGLLTMVEARDGILEAREITNPEWMLGGKLSSTFHGRDIFSPVGARIARGDDWSQVGPLIAAKDLVLLQLVTAKMDETGLSGEIIGTDGPYGNLITNIEAAQFAQLGYSLGDKVDFTIAGRHYAVRFVHTFSDVARNEALLYIDSRGRLAIAVNQGNAQSRLGVTIPAALTFPKKKV
jgi:S-adenosylmethionine hydrolase